MSDLAIPAATSSPRRGARIAAFLMFLALLAALGFAGKKAWQKLDATTGTLEAEDALIRRMGYQLHELEGQNEALAQRVTDAEAGSRRLNASLASVNGVQQSQGQTLAQIDATLTGSRARFQLAAVEELLQLAADRVALSRDRNTAVQALELADARLAALGDARLLKVREAISAERLALLAVPVPDVAGTALTLGGLIAREGDLPLAVRPPSTFAPPAVAQPPAAALPANAGWTARTWAGIKEAMNAVVRIKREVRPVDALLPPEQEVLIHHMLLMRLEAARLALLRAEPAATRDALSSASAWLTRYYKTDDPGVRSALAELDRLALVPSSTPLPVPMRGLQALQLVLKTTPAKP